MNRPIALFAESGWPSALACLLLVAATTSVSARTKATPDDTRTAQQCYRDGLRFKNKQQYSAAYHSFAESYKKHPLPLLRFQMARACFLYFDQVRSARAQLWIERAIKLYQQAIDAAPQASWIPMAREELHMAVARKAALPTTLPALPPPPKTQLLITSDTPCARIQVGDLIEPAPLMQTVAAGQHTVRVTAAGYAARERTVTAVARRLVRINIDLEPKPGRLRVLADQDRATVYLDGKPVARTPAELPAIAPGEHDIAIGARGRQLWRTKLGVTSERTAITMVNLAWSTQRKVAVGIGIGGLAVAGAAVVTGILGLQVDSSLDSGLPRGPTAVERQAWDDRLRHRDRLGTATIILFSTAAVALVTTAMLWIFDMPAAPLVHETKAGQRKAALGPGGIVVVF